MKTKAAVLIRGKKGPEAFELMDWELSALTENEVLIESEGFGLNYADIMASQGLYREAPPRPCVIGYEVVGKVIEVAKGVSEEWIGKRVLAFTRFGGYAQKVKTQINAIVEVNDAPIEDLMALATQGVTAIYMSQHVINVTENDKVLVHAAAGGVGSLLVQMAKAKGANVIGNVGSPEKAELVKSLGADETIQYKKERYVDKVQKFFGKGGLSVSFNAVAGDSFKKDLKLLGAGGRLVLFGGAQLTNSRWGIFSALNFIRKMGRPLPIGLMMTSKSVVGVNMLKIADHHPNIIQKCLSEVLEMYQKGNLRIIRGGTFRIEEISKAHDLLASGKSMGKVVVLW